MIGDTTTKRFRISFNVLGVLTVIALLLAAWAFYSRFTSTNQLREGQHTVWHAVICTVVAAEESDQRTSKEDKARQVRFWNRLLIKDVGAQPCSRKEIHAPPIGGSNAH